MSPLPTFTVFDVETTGLDPRKGDKIIEIAGVRIIDGVIHESDAFLQLVNPERTIPWEAARINKISDQDVVSAPTIDQVLPRFLEFAQGSLLVAHNCEFDMGFLRVEKELCWGYVELPECICTMRLSQTVHPHEFRHSLDTVSARCGVVMPSNRHRALPDVLMTAQSLLAMMKKADIRTLEQLRKMAGKPSLAVRNG